MADPAFRPKIKVPRWVSLIGCAGCFLAMFSIHPVACFVAIVVEGDLVGPEPEPCAPPGVISGAGCGSRWLGSPC